MLQKSKTDQPVVQAVLEEVLNRVLDEKLAGFATKQDLAGFATKQDLDEKLEAYDLRIDIKLDKLKMEIDENARNYRDQIMDKYSETIGDIGTLKEENAIGAHQYHELQESVDRHEERIAALEQKQAAV